MVRTLTPASRTRTALPFTFAFTVHACALARSEPDDDSTRPGSAQEVGALTKIVIVACLVLTRSADSRCRTMALLVQDRRGSVACSGMRADSPSTGSVKTR